ncbi:MAG: DMT family transporter [Tepidiformaceae bacterium]
MSSAPDEATAPALSRLLVLGVGVGAVSWAAIFVRLADDAPALSIAAYRMLFATLAIGAFAGLRLWLGRERLPARATLPLLALSGLFLAAHFWSWFASLERTSVGSSVVIVAMQPLLAAALAFLFLREAPSSREYAGIALAAVGLAVIAGGDLAQGGGELGGNALALLGALLAAAYRTVGRKLRPGMSALVYSTAVYAVAAAILWALVPLAGARAGGYDAETWTWLLLLAAVPQVVGHTAFNWALAHFRVVTVSIANMGEPVAATLLAIPILGEEPSGALLLGAPFILAGIFVAFTRPPPGNAALAGAPANGAPPSGRR